MTRFHRALLLCCLALPAAPWPAPAAAQEVARLTAEDAAAIADFYNRPAMTRLSGEARIAPGAEVDGSIAALGGPLHVAGRVRGSVLVVNGDLRLLPGGEVTGSVTIVGGGFDGDTAAVGGEVLVYPDPLRFRREGDRIIALRPGAGVFLQTRRPTWFGIAELNLAVDGSYNRVEGLPVIFGPRVELGRSNPTVLDARLIYRTQSGLRVHPDELGHDLRAEQYIGGHRSLRVGVGRHRTVDPIEERGLSDTENSLSTFILHRDYRDHYHRRGWSAYLAYSGRARPLDLRLEYRDESHGATQSNTPWSLLSNDEPWRPQPLVAEGDLQSIRASLRWDSRNDPVEPASGWLVSLDVEQGLEGDLALVRNAGDPPVAVMDPVEAEFTAMTLDVRRYLRLGPRTRVAFRAHVAGSPDDGALPPQRQHALGGEGSLPGFSRFQFDCGARGAALVDGFFPYYGCDRIVLLQGELRFALLGDTGFSLGRRLGLDFDLVTSPELVLFADAGRGWIEAESLEGREELGPRDLSYDAGIGLRLGRIGFYIAAPISEGGDGLNFMVRLGPRL